VIVPCGILRVSLLHHDDQIASKRSEMSHPGSCRGSETRPS
jgi:hypothetical protein